MQPFRRSSSRCSSRSSPRRRRDVTAAVLGGAIALVLIPFYAGRRADRRRRGSVSRRLEQGVSAVWLVGRRRRRRDRRLQGDRASAARPPRASRLAGRAGLGPGPRRARGARGHADGRRASRARRRCAAPGRARSSAPIGGASLLERRFLRRRSSAAAAARGRRSCGCLAHAERDDPALDETARERGLGEDLHAVRRRAGTTRSRRRRSSERPRSSRGGRGRGARSRDRRPSSSRKRSDGLRADLAEQQRRPVLGEPLAEQEAGAQLDRAPLSPPAEREPARSLLEHVDVVELVAAVDGRRRRGSRPGSASASPTRSAGRGGSRRGRLRSTRLRPRPSGPALRPARSAPTAPIRGSASASAAAAFTPPPRRRRSRRSAASRASGSRRPAALLRQCLRAACALRRDLGHHAADPSAPQRARLGEYVGDRVAAAPHRHGRQAVADDDHERDGVRMPEQLGAQEQPGPPQRVRERRLAAERDLLQPPPWRVRSSRSGGSTTVPSGTPPLKATSATLSPRRVASSSSSKTTPFTFSTIRSA